ncbi:MAG: hypothetical protein K940chlam7_01079 [Chlamydiae bacterium]|nr:hypothetical protein [Chlamydiota bacterium]
MMEKLEITKWIYLVAILLIAFVGGYGPLFKHTLAPRQTSFPRGEAFSAGVFLALSLTMLLPSSFHLFQEAYPGLEYPIASVIAILAFLVLLTIEHLMYHTIPEEERQEEGVPLPAVIPLIMTAMIAFPSFLLGAALGMSEVATATLIFIAIILHKGTAAFALALSMVRSTLSRPQTLILFTLFTITTPLGILFGEAFHEYIASWAMLIKPVVLSLGAGTFLYMGTLQGMKHSSLIKHCSTRSGFLAMLAGLFITAFVRFIVGEAHRL